MPYELDRKGWLALLFAGSNDAIDRVRIQKAMFLFAMRSNVSEFQKYEFIPYHYGPFCSQIYRDLEDLVRIGHLETVHREGESSPSYRITMSGERHARFLTDMASENSLGFLRQIRAYVQRLEFGALLRAVYDAYPDYATRSVFRQA
jgi:uncharacterized protein YwgA